jgi:hypothetical protein
MHWFHKFRWCIIGFKQKAGFCALKSKKGNLSANLMVDAQLRMFGIYYLSITSKGRNLQVS